MHPTWPIHQAKAKLGELVRAAQAEPQIITVYSLPKALVVSEAYYGRIVKAALKWMEWERTLKNVGQTGQIDQHSRHCEPQATASPEAAWRRGKQSSPEAPPDGLPRRYAPRNDADIVGQTGQIDQHNEPV